MELGYQKPLFILPFDHRSSFIKNMFGITGQPTSEQSQQVIELKNIIYDGFSQAVKDGVPADYAAILVDEQFGDAVLRQAKQAGFTVCLSVEKSGQDEFDFEYGDQFQDHIKKYQPTFAKALIRYNPESDLAMNRRQQERLKRLTDFCHSEGFKFLIEPLVPATAAQLEKVNGDKERYDNELRPQLMVTMIKELQAGGVEPDIWKIEGLNHEAEYKMIVEQARSGGRKNVGAIILGRGADEKGVETWLRAGANVNGMMGFAIGRTIFWQPLKDYTENKISRADATAEIAKRFYHFYQVFIQAQQ